MAYILLSKMKRQRGRNKSEEMAGEVESDQRSITVKK